MTTIFTKQDIEAAAKAICDEQKPAPWTRGPLFPCEHCERIADKALTAAMASVQERGAMSGDGAAWESSFGWVFHELQPFGKEHPAVVIILDKEAP